MLAPAEQLPADEPHRGGQVAHKTQQKRHSSAHPFAFVSCRGRRCRPLLLHEPALNHQAAARLARWPVLPTPALVPPPLPPGAPAAAGGRRGAAACGACCRTLHAAALPRRGGAARGGGAPAGEVKSMAVGTLAPAGAADPPLLAGPLAGSAVASEAAASLSRRARLLAADALGGVDQKQLGYQIFCLSTDCSGAQVEHTPGAGQLGMPAGQRRRHANKQASRRAGAATSGAPAAQHTFVPLRPVQRQLALQGAAGKAGRCAAARQPQHTQAGGGPPLAARRAFNRCLPPGAPLRFRAAAGARTPTRRGGTPPAGRRRQARPGQAGC